MKILNRIFAISLLLLVVVACKKEEPINTSSDGIAIRMTPENPFVGTNTIFEVNDPFRFDDYKYLISSDALENDSIIDAASFKYEFYAEGMYKITLMAGMMDKEMVIADSQTIQVIENKLIAPKTLYLSTAGEPFTYKQGQLYSVDLTNTGALEKNPLEIPCGQNTFNLQWTNDRLYYFSSGDRFQYSTTLPVKEDNVGFIKSFSPLDYSTTTHIIFGDGAYDDAFAGYVYDGNIYWEDRNANVGKVSVDTKNNTFGGWIKKEGDELGIRPEWYFEGAVTNTLYEAGAKNDIVMGSGVGYHYNIQNINNEWWISKAHQSNIDLGQAGIWKLVKDAKKASEIVKIDRESAFEPIHDYVFVGQKDSNRKSQILGDYLVANFALSSTNIYFSVAHDNPGKNVAGIYLSDLEGNNVELIDVFDKDEIDGTIALYHSAHGYHSSIAIDEEGAKVYWTVTNDDVHNPTGFSGVKSYDINSGDIKNEVEVNKPLGIALAPAYTD